ncbi:site-specific DNA-methyltransferase [Aidingimonas halophila]|uniref:site-specific DNA-methyltransferase (adenine-specific) n=1 Tax=Aidingimonas halophila TaxID=574349 RepID=A0A1H2U2P4_9GAMM|nr:site-specific DNA-methyltransferase [Aidingimonas halophila]GHC22133.1 site-specific DNA-methyltransferase [Aidingimonas halophila]SDW50483.1 adenine-specific DNA-methyltransferase [Aidingimonas halophila]
MAIEKLNMETKDASLKLVDAIEKILPEAITEVRDDKGGLKRGIDFSLLKHALHGIDTDDTQERYHLDWPGKRSALVDSNSAIQKTLRPCTKESVSFYETKNLFIEGDNLEAMKLVREGYLEKVDVIYIDPPYNTGSDLIYEDDFSSDVSSQLSATNQKDAEGNRLVTNLNSNGRFHSDWLTMMYSRLRVARQLLKESGIVFISIDDNERANLQKLCEEVFGGSNFLGCFVWKRRSGAMDAVANLSEDHEYVLVYTKAVASLKGVERTFEKYSNPDNDSRGAWISDNLSAGKPGGDTYYSIRDPETGNEFWPPKGRYWPYSRQTMAKKISEGRVIFPKSLEGTPMLKRFASEAMKPTIPVSSWIERPGSSAGQSTIVSPMNSFATREFKNLFGEKLFSFPKPVELIQAIITQGAPEDALVMDFFAGSATTAHAVFACNAKDGGNRRFILVQLPEEIEETSAAYSQGFETIADLAKERIRVAGKKSLEGECHPGWKKDIGFRVLKVSTTNMKDTYYRPDSLSQQGLLDSVENVKEGRTPTDLLFQVFVDWGVDLSLPISRHEVDGKTVFLVDGAEKHMALAACFDLEIDEAFVKQLAEYEPLRVVFRDAGFASDSVKINVEQIFAQKSPNTDVKVI